MIQAVERITAYRALQDDMKRVYHVYEYDGKHYRIQEPTSLPHLNFLAFLAEDIRLGRKGNDYILASSPHIGVGTVWCAGQSWEYRYNGDADVYYMMGKQFDNLGLAFEEIRSGDVPSDNHLEGLNDPI